MDVIRPVFAEADLAQLPDDGKRYEIFGRRPRGESAAEPQASAHSLSCQRPIS